MTSLSKYKKILEEETQQILTNEEAEPIFDAMYQFTRLAFEKWAREKGLKNKLHANV